MADAGFTVTSGTDRLSQREQIELVVARARERQEPIRVRLPFTLYEYSTERAYTFVRDAVWNIQLPVTQTTPETIEKLIDTIGRCIVAIAQEGSDEIMRRLLEPPPPQAQEEAPAP